MNDDTRINWKYEGKPDFVNGTGAYFEEKLLGYGASLIIPAFLLSFMATGQVDWNPLQSAIALLLAFDVGGGVISNTLNSGKRFYHSPVKAEEGRLGKVLKNKGLFSLLHVHPIVVYALFDFAGVWQGILWYGLFLASAATVITAPLYLKRPLAILILTVVILLNFYIIASVPGFEWLMPLLFLKIIYGHLVKEEPYRKTKRL